jgi:PDZ domain-containing secreted protein
MIVVKVELWSAITHEKTELARMVIANAGDSKNPRKGNYEFATIRGRSAAGLELGMWSWLRERKGATKTGQLMQHNRLSEHVWNLVAKALSKMDYGDMNGAY